MSNDAGHSHNPDRSDTEENPMSNDDYDEHVEYVDEDGNPIDPDELGDDVEFVDEYDDEEITEDTTGHQQAAPEPAQDPAQGAGTPSPFGLLPEDDEPVYVPEVAHQPEPAPTGNGGNATAVTAVTQDAADAGGGLPRGLVLGGAGILTAAALVVGGGLWLWQGPSNTVEEVREEVAAAAEREPEPIDACDGVMLRDAEITGKSSEPTMQLRVVDSVALPAQMSTRLRGQGSTAEVEMLQQRDRSVTVYIAEQAEPSAPGERQAQPPAFPWWTATVDTDGGLSVAGEEPGAGGDADAATACPGVPSVGAYRVVGDVPESAQGMRPDQAEVAALKPDGARPSTVFLVAGDMFLETELEWNEEATTEKKEREEAGQTGE